MSLCMQLGWACSVCTYLNKPTRPGCEMCGGERPAEYTVPDIYQPDEEEIKRIQQETLAMMQYEQVKVLIVKKQLKLNPFNTVSHLCVK